MKRFLTIFLLAAVLLSLLGCGARPDTGEKTEAEVAVQPQDDSSAAVPEGMTEGSLPEETTYPWPEDEEGYLFLTVSDIALSVVSESEDIYIGTIPREEVTWESDDETVATFEDGILTATGVGTTRVYASYGDQRLECTVRCLVETEEELITYDFNTLRSPKRYPPAMGDDPCGFFNDAVFVGDSISQTLFQQATMYGELGSAQFLVRGGVSIFGFVIDHNGVYYRGSEMKVEDAIAAIGAKKVFILLGQNDLSYRSIDETMESWVLFLDAIKEKNPGIEIYLQSCVPEWHPGVLRHDKNEMIDQHNIRLKAFAEENGYHYVEIARYIEDHTNNMASVYSMDQSIHLNVEAINIWIDALKIFAMTETR